MQSIENKVYKNSGNNLILSLITKNNSLILDIGCGGGNAQILYEEGHVLDGITISTKEKELNDPYFRDIQIYNIENGLPFNIMKNKYDVVICSHVLEHICYPEKVLNDIKSVLAKEGIFLVALPNIMHYKSRLSLMFGDFYFEDSGLWDNTHFKWYTFRSAKELLESHDFIVEQIIADGDLPLNSVFSKILSLKAQKLLYRFLTKISKGLFGYQMVFVSK